MGRFPVIIKRECDILWNSLELAVRVIAFLVGLLRDLAEIKACMDTAQQSMDVPFRMLSEALEKNYAVNQCCVKKKLQQSPETNVTRCGSVWPWIRLCVDPRWTARAAVHMMRESGCLVMNDGISTERRIRKKAKLHGEQIMKSGESQSHCWHWCTQLMLQWIQL